MKTFSHYTIEGKLGEGGMGEVFKARDPRLDRSVALKFLTEAFASDPERLARFEREARVLASLTHAHIASIYGLEEDHGQRALVLEYVPGEDLSQLISRGPVPIDDALDIARQVADALDAAHEQGIVHRDLKPANIKIMKDGTVKVLDFGLAKALGTDGGGTTSDPSITQSPTLMGTAHGVILGTAAYMSPEQARGKSVDKRADIWAFGVVLLEMLTGRQTFQGETISDTVAAILRAEPEWELLPADTPPAVAAVLRRCLEKDPRRRLRDIGEARIAIEGVQRGDADTTAIHAASISTTGVHPAAVAPAQPPAVPVKKRGLFKRLVFGTLRVIHWMFTLMFMAAWITFMVLYIVEVNKEPEKPPVIRALITPEEGRAFNNITFASHAFHALSQDGSKITFISDNYLWVRSLNEINARRLEGTESANFPFWSPDGRMIGFFADGKLKTIAAMGGPVNVVADAPQARGGTWNRHDVIVFTPALREGLYRIPASGGTPVQVTKPNRPTHSTHRWPRFLPDGDHIVYMAANHTNPKGAQTAIYLTSLSTGEEELLVPADSHPVYASGYLLYTRDRNLMAHPFSPRLGSLRGDPVRIAENCAHNGGSWVGCFDARRDVLTYQGGAPPIGSQLTWIDRDGKRLGTVGGHDLNWDVAVSPDGHWVAIARGNPEPSIYIYDIEGNVEQRLTVDGSFSRAPVWSPDSKRIVYASIRDNGRLNLYEVPRDRSASARPVLVDDVDMIPTSWSPNGRELLVDYGDPGETEIWVVSMTGEPDPKPVVQTDPWVYRGAFSADGRWIAYTSREEGDDFVFVAPYPATGAKVKVSNSISTGPMWDLNTQRLFVVGNSVMEAPFQIENNRIRFGAVRRLFTVVGDSSLFVQSGSDVSLARDGRFLCMVASDDPAKITALTLVVGWNEELDAR